MTPIAECIFWVGGLAVAGTYLLYPATLKLLTAGGRDHRTGDDLPTVTLMISAYNEAKVIREKLDNALALDYPPDRLEIMVISDASDDGTDEIVASYADRGVRLERQDRRRGKSAGLTRFVPQARGEILVFSDANSIYSADALRRLVRHFADSHVGYVVGSQRYIGDGSQSSESESLYWRYETWLKIQESRMGSVVGGDGAIYAIRADLFEPLRDDDINDFVLPLKIVARGFRGIFDETAVCYERSAQSFGAEFRRKTRIVNRSLRAVCRVPQALNPFRVGVFAYQLAVHKVLRWFVPVFLVALLAANVPLALGGATVYRTLLVLQAAFYGFALLHFIPRLAGAKPVYVAFYFCLVNLAAAVGIAGFLLGRRFVVWTPERQTGGQPTAVSGG